MTNTHEKLLKIMSLGRHKTTTRKLHASQTKRLILPCVGESLE